MKARSLGRFVGEFIEGLSGGKDVAGEETAAPAMPPVIPIDTVREAVTPMIRQIVVEMLQQAMAGEEEAPSGQQLDMMFHDAAPPADPLADATVRRVTEIREREAERERQARNGGAVPETFDPNVPGDKPWMGANLQPETIDRNTA